MSRFANLREIESLDPERDCQRIMYRSFGSEFPWDSTRSLEVALHRTYCVPSIWRLRDRSAADFLTGAHAIKQADALLTTEAGF